MDDQILKANIQARKSAKELLDIGFSEVDEFKQQGPFSEPRYWEIIAEKAAALAGYKLVKADDTTVMTDEEARKFELSRVPYGQYKDQMVVDVDPKYWVIIREGEFNKQLSRWMRTSRFRNLQNYRAATGDPDDAE